MHILWIRTACFLHDLIFFSVHDFDITASSKSFSIARTVTAHEEDRKPGGACRYFTLQLYTFSGGACRYLQLYNEAFHTACWHSDHTVQPTIVLFLPRSLHLAFCCLQYMQRRTSVLQDSDRRLDSLIFNLLPPPPTHSPPQERPGTPAVAWEQGVVAWGWS